MAAPIVGVAPIFAIFFGGCAVGKRIQGKKPGEELTFVENFMAGGIAGVFTTIVMTPGERIKCILQVQGESMGKKGEPQYKGPIDVVTKLYKEGGMRSIYRGTFATLLRGKPRL